MGVIGKLIGGPGAVAAMGQAAQGVAEVFVPSATRRMELSAEAQMAALKQLGDEYGLPATGWFDRMVNGLNRLPRPMLAFGTIGLFVYAMVDPVRFSGRMVVECGARAVVVAVGCGRGLLLWCARDLLFSQPAGARAGCRSGWCARPRKPRAGRLAARARLTRWRGVPGTTISARPGKRLVYSTGGTRLR